MVHDPALLDALERFETEPWKGPVFRHMLGSNAPELANLRGARWNPPGIPALYTSLAESTAKAEGDHLLSMQPVPPQVTRTIYELTLSLENLLNLRARERLAAVGIEQEQLIADAWGPCQAVGAAVAWLGHDGLLVPSVRDGEGANLVVFTANRPPKSELRIRTQRQV